MQFLTISVANIIFPDWRLYLMGWRRRGANRWQVELTNDSRCGITLWCASCVFPLYPTSEREIPLVVECVDACSTLLVHNKSERRITTWSVVYRNQEYANRWVWGRCSATYRGAGTWVLEWSSAAAAWDTDSWSPPCYVVWSAVGRRILSESKIGNCGCFWDPFTAVDGYVCECRCSGD